MATRYIDTKDVAKLIRKDLKANFPSIKFSVRSSTYSLGCSIDITWTDGPTTKQVDAVVQQYASCYFDSSQDMKCYKARESEIAYLCDYVGTRRNYSLALYTEAANAIYARFGYAAPEITALEDGTMPRAINQDYDKWPEGADTMIWRELEQKHYWSQP